MQKKKILTIFLIIFILFGMLSHSVGVLANEQIDINKNNEVVDNNKNYSRAYLEYLELSDEEKSKLDVIPRKYNIPLDSLYEDTIEVKEEPSLFNLYGLRAQTNIVSAYSDELPEQFNLRDEIEIPTKNQGHYGLCWAFSSIRSFETNLALNGYGDHDFSEWHVAYIQKNGFGYEINENSGGNFYDFEEYAANNHGPVLESEVPYATKYSEDEFEYLYNLESKAYIQKTVEFPTIDKMWETYTDEELELFRDKVKKHIMENGSIYASIYSDDIKYINGYSTLYNTNGWTNHAISVIGWDDNFSKENFQDENGNMPNNNGAYIILNSWGELDEIIYVSYEDTTIERDMSGVVDATTQKEDVTKIIKFEDENLYEVIKEKMGKNILSFNNETMEITCVNSDTITLLDLSYKEINNIRGLENFTNLETLDLTGNNITEINPLWNIKTLKTINVSENKLDNLGTVSSMPNLTELNISNNNIISIDNISILNGLEVLYMQGNQLININEIQSLQKLIYLNISENKIENIDFIENLSNISYLTLSYCNIQDVSSLALLKNLYILDLSGNPITVGLDKLTNISAINLNNCNLDDSVLDMLSNLTNLTRISLRDNNIIDARKLESLELYYLNLSGNKNLQLETVPLFDQLTLEECNISDVSVFSNFKGYGLNLSDNPITDVSPLKDIQIESLDLSNTNISDVSSLNKVLWLDISDNDNITGLDQLSSATTLRLNNCNISNITELANLINLQNLYLENNNLTNVDSLTNLTNLEYLYLDNNNITNVDSLVNLSKLRHLNVSNNDITRVPDFLNFENLMSINFSNNKITNIDNLANWPEDCGVYVDLCNNFIGDVPNVSSIDFLLENQIINEDINIKLNINNRIIIPSIIRNAYEERFKYWEFGKNSYEGQTRFETQNCEIDFANNQIIINPAVLGEGTATINIKGGNHDGTNYTINYNTQEELELVDIEVTKLPNKLIYVEGENFEQNGMIVQEIYENDIREKVNDYIIVDGEDIKAEQEYITVKYKELDVQVPITVYSKDDVIELEVQDEKLIDTMMGWRQLIIRRDSPCSAILSREAASKITSIDLFDIENISGLECFENLQEIWLNKSDYIKTEDDRIELPKYIYQLLTLWSGNNAEAIIYYDTYYYDVDPEKMPFINYNENKKAVDIEMDYENEKAYITVDKEIKQNNVVRGGIGR